MAVRTVRTASWLTSADQIQVKATRAAIPMARPPATSAAGAGFQSCLNRLRMDSRVTVVSFGTASVSRGLPGPIGNAPYSFCSTMASDSSRFIMDWNSGEPSLSQ